MIDVIKNKKIFFTLSGTLITISAILMIVFGFRQGIDLAGGTNWQIKINGSAVTEKNIKDFLTEAINYPNLIVRREVINNVSGFSVRLPSISESEHQDYFQKLKEQFGEIEELRFESVGASIGHELRAKAFWAGILVLFGISLYVAWAFRKVSRPVSSWKYGIITVVTLFHDIIIPSGFLAFLGWWRGIEIDTNFIVALLVIMGFSVHDTIVVFDRIRENLSIHRSSKKTLFEVINISIKETFARSVNTSLTLILVLLAMIFWGPSPLFYFILTILTGTVIGTYSSIFIASPLLTVIVKERY